MHDRWHGSAGGSLGAEQDLREDGTQTAVSTHGIATHLPAATVAPAEALLVRMQSICHFTGLLCAVLTDEDHEDECGLGESLSCPGSFGLLQ